MSWIIAVGNDFNDDVTQPRMTVVLINKNSISDIRYFADMNMYQIHYTVRDGDDQQPFAKGIEVSPSAWCEVGALDTTELPERLNVLQAAYAEDVQPRLDRVNAVVAAQSDKAAREMMQWMKQKNIPFDVARAGKDVS